MNLDEILNLIEDRLRALDDDCTRLAMMPLIARDEQIEANRQRETQRRIGAMIELDALRSRIMGEQQ